MTRNEWLARPYGRLPGTAGALALAFFQTRFSASAHKVFRRASGGSSSICILFEKAHKLSSRNT